MKAKCVFMASLYFLLIAISSISAQEKVYYDVVQQLMDFEFANSDVMENANMITNIFGGRFSKTPSYRAAAEWARDRLKGYGLTNAHLEGYEFGNGWDFDYVSVHMMSPDYVPIIAFPALWSSGTNGKIRANAIHINFDEITSVRDLEQYRGKLRGKIVFIMPIQELSPFLVSKCGTGQALFAMKTDSLWSGAKSGSMRCRKSPFFPRNRESLAVASPMN